MEDQGKRILLFVVIAAVIFIAFQKFGPKPSEETKSTPAGSASEGPTPSVASRVGQVAPDPDKPAVAPATMAAPVAEAPEETIELRAKAVDVTFSSQGGVIRSWKLRHDPFKGRDMDELAFGAGGPGQGLVATNFLSSTHVIPVGATWKGEKLSETAVRYTYRDDVLAITKDFELFPDDFLVKIHVEVRAVAGEVRQQLALSMYSAGDGVQSPALRPACHLNGRAASVSPAKLYTDLSLREKTGRVRFAGFARKFYLIALSPKDEGSTQLGCFRAPLEGVVKGSQVDLVYPEARFSAADKGGISKDLVLYVGPKYFDRLEGADKLAGWNTGMKSVIDLGWFAFIARPMLWLLHALYGVFGNWGIAIILLTVLVKLATLYWTTKSMRSMKAMAALKPEMEAIQKRYPDDRAKQQQAQMDLFRQHGVSPLAGCLPMLLQMPIWIALYRMLSSAGELHHATFIPGWLDDLTLPDPFYILPLTLTGMMFLQSKLQPASGDSAQQKILMYGMPLMFGAMSLVFPSGLTVYIFTNTVLGILHSLYMNRTTAKLAPARAAVARVEAEEKVPAEVRQAKRVEAEVSDSGDDDERPAKGGPGKNGAGGGGKGRKGQQRRSQRR